jgi:hypothetical protein
MNWRQRDQLAVICGKLATLTGRQKDLFVKAQLDAIWYELYKLHELMCKQARGEKIDGHFDLRLPQTDRRTVGDNEPTTSGS